MEVPELEFALKLVQVMAHALENGGKVISLVLSLIPLSV